MTLGFLILAVITVLGAIGTMALRNLVHCALCLVVTFAGLAGLFLQLEAQFVGLVQILVYVGAVAILVVFAILLTRQADADAAAPIATGTAWGLVIATGAFLIFGGAIRKSLVSWRLPPPPPEAGARSVRAIGDRLMSEYVLPLEVLGLLLTAALIGAVILAMTERPPASSAGASAPASPDANPPPA